MTTQLKREADSKPLFLGAFHRPDHHGFDCRLCGQRADYIVTALIGGNPFVGRVCFAHAEMTGHALLKHDFQALTHALEASGHTG